MYLYPHINYVVLHSEPVVYSCDTNLENVSFYNNFPSSTVIKALTPVPGLLLVHSNNGIVLLHPQSLNPVNIHGLASSEENEQTMFQFAVVDSVFSVLKVWDIQYDTHLEQSIPMKTELRENRPDEKIRLWKDSAPTHLYTPVTSEESSSFGSCRVALAINNRLIILCVE